MITREILRAKLAPYRAGIVMGIIGGVLCAVFWAGLKVGRWQGSEALHAAQQRVTALEAQVSGQGRLLDEANAAAATAKRERDAARKAANAAESAAESAEAQRQARERDFARQLQRARKNPDCAAILAIDVEAVCKL